VDGLSVFTPLPYLEFELGVMMHEQSRTLLRGGMVYGRQNRRLSPQAGDYIALSLLYPT